ncbi:MAG: DUF3868 domain-containing protein [Prevotellaceae bacterium]|nr:DUF3868 domain-containing protein [Prevotellaceae bacterium]
MKHTLLLSILALATSSLAAQDIVDGVSVSSYSLQRDGNELAVDLDLSLTDLSVKRNRAVLVTPRLVSGTDSIDLPSLAVYGHQRYIYYKRSDEMLATSEGDNYRLSDKPDSKQYHELLPYEPWMNGATLWLHRDLYGCCSAVLDEQAAPLGQYKVFEPQFLFIRPEARKDPRSIEGRAFIDFHVDKTNIDPDYRRNSTELALICATIDSVRGDEDASITSIRLKGFASPESPYSHNAQLAKGRTEALKQYLKSLYGFPDTLIATDSEPEDWQGLRRFVEGSQLEHKEEILALIDQDIDPDLREARIKAEYPQQYKFLLDNCYPALRHTEYRIAYQIRPYGNLDEIRRVFRQEPGKLSLNELYLLAEDYEPGSEEFSEVFETAVRLYPDSETANLNAASAALRRGDIETAKKFLSKAGDSGEADYTRGVVAIMEQDYTNARTLLESAKRKGTAEADYCLDYINGK